ncbi:hypothetical protein [Pandoravirus japonicus]|uniref:Uncharacterized protein n=1 Tax=Pandoravirus japonicus TaxID=2823154 RepID=A0A811BPX3_9VIRU|nr:hypothetical protein [Pandoravirus japonicus]
MKKRALFRCGVASFRPTEKARRRKKEKKRKERIARPPGRLWLRARHCLAAKVEAPHGTAETDGDPRPPRRWRNNCRAWAGAAAGAP